MREWLYKVEENRNVETEKEKTMEFNYLVKNDDGTINIDLTVEAYREALENYVEETETVRDTVLATTTELLRMAGTKVPIDSAIGLCVCKLNPANVTSFAKSKKLVEGIIRDNTNGKNEESKRFCAATGKGGGLYLNKKHPANQTDDGPASSVKTEDSAVA